MQDDTACLLLEYVENGSLAAEVQRCRREERQISDACIIDWASQILLGLLYLHRKEVVHRDLKTENLLGPSLDGCVKIADFGISKRLGGAALARSLVGTLEVMAPERVQALHEGVGASPSEYGPESDLWSLGVVLYELAVLRAPFSEDRPDLSAQERQQRLIDRIRHEKPTPLPFSRAAVLHKVVIGGLLQKQPSQRPSAADLCRDPDLGRSIQHFLQKQRLLDHPSILEILDVLPNIDPEGSFIGSDLDVVTLRSHRSSLNGSLDGPFLDGARLSASELRKLLPEDLAEVFEPVEVKNAGSHVPSEPAEPRRRKASKRMEASTAATVASVLPQRAASHPGVLGPVASPSDQTSQSLSSTTSTASSPRPPPFPRPIPPRPSLGPDLAWPESMRGANRRALANLKRPDSNQGEDSRLPGALDRNSVSSASSLPGVTTPLATVSVERQNQEVEPPPPPATWSTWSFSWLKPILLYVLLELLQRCGLPILNSARAWALISVLCFSAWYSVEPKRRPQKWTPPKDVPASPESLEEFLECLAQQLNERSPPTDVKTLKADGWKDISTRGAQIFMKMLKVPRMLTQICINVNSSDQEKYFPWVMMEGNSIKGGAIPIFLALDHWPSWFPFCQKSEKLAQLGTNQAIFLVRFKIAFLTVDIVPLDETWSSHLPLNFIHPPPPAKAAATNLDNLGDIRGGGACALERFTPWNASCFAGIWT
eukprot:symbB.v1.2.000143.t1/scaffold16.1/size461936/17